MQALVSHLRSDIVLSPTGQLNQKSIGSALGRPKGARFSVTISSLTLCAIFICVLSLNNHMWEGSC